MADSGQDEEEGRALRRPKDELLAKAWHGERPSLAPVAGAQEAAKELQNPEALTFTGPTAENSVAGQIDIVTNAKTQGVGAVMISNNAGDQIAPAAKAVKKPR